MRNRSLGATLLASVALIVGACSSTGTASNAAASQSAAPSAAASTSASAAASPSASESSAASASASGSASASASAASSAGANLKIGVVTDIGSLNDKNFNEYSYKGAVDGAHSVGAADPVSIVPKDQAEYAQDIQSLIDQKYDVIVTVGFNLASATTKAAHDNPNTWFIGVDQSPICVTDKGLPDPDFGCKGDAKTLLPKYISLQFAEDQAGYLAGIVAAGVSKNAEIGAIGGTTLCAPCVRYIQGYELGAKSVNPNIKVTSAYVTKDFSNAAFQDQPGGKRFAENFLAQNPKIDVLFQVAGLTGNGVLDAACAKGINGIGVDVDQVLSYPASAKCLVTSAEKHLETAVSDAIGSIANRNATPGDNLFDAKNDGIGVADYHDAASKVPADIQQKVTDALNAMKSGSLKTCPDKCGSLS